MLHPSWSYLYLAMAGALGALDGLSPQTWNMPGQRYETMRLRTVIGVGAPLISIAILSAVAMAVDRFTLVAKIHPYVATAAGVVIIGIAACSIFWLITEYANGDGDIRPMNLLSGIVPLLAFKEFLPTPAGVGAVFLICSAAAVFQSSLTLVGFAAMFAVGAFTVVALARHTAAGVVAYPSWMTHRLFVLAPILSSTLLLLIGSLIIHGNLEIDLHAYDAQQFQFKD